jgi:type IV pilus assembly protein PilC
VARFAYKALDEDGKQVRAVVESDTLVAARAAVAERKLELVKIKEKKGALNFELTKKKIPPQAIMHFSRQLAAFVRAGLPILDALEVIGDESDSPVLKRVLREVREALRGGATLSSAVAEHKDLFPPFYIDMLRSAELTGHLDYVLDQLARYIERDLEAKRRIRAALAYPSIVMGMALVTVVILTAFVLPRFRRFFSSLNATLPLPTRLLLGFSGFLARWYLIILGFGIAVGVLLFMWMRTDKGREARDRFILKLPVIGSVARHAIIERFCRILSSMVRAGVPLPEAMIIVGQGTNNKVYEKALNEVREEMLAGEGIAMPISRTGLFPASVVQMIRVGEDTGTLDDQLSSAAEYFDTELDFKIKRLTTLFEPAVIVGVGLIVGFVALALVSAMYGIFNQAGKI